MRVLLTGATGFVGRALSAVLSGAGYVVRAAVRESGRAPPGCTEVVRIGDIGPETDWESALGDVDQVMHLAARAHVPDDDPAGAALYARVNALGTQRLAAAAAAAGIARFILLSTVKVNGERTTQHAAYGPADEPRPQDEYAKSKWAAEQHLTAIAAGSAMQSVIIRSPLVYGPGVRANFLRLMQWIDSGWPLPLALVHNRRSLVSIWNLCDLLLKVMSHGSAPGRTFMASDGEDLATPELVRRLGRAMGRQVRLLPVPVGVLRLCGMVSGREQEIARLCESLAVDISRTREMLDWSAPLSVEEGLARTAAWYAREAKG